ncbi:MAG: L,D-transpeptidase [Clostridia bacterium]|nr:L,D-transpeptidase [Clostridia bacterium]
MFRKLLLTFFIAVTCIIAVYAIRNVLPGRVTNAVNYSKAKVLYNLGLANTQQDYKNSMSPSKLLHTRYAEPDKPLKEILQDKKAASVNSFNIYVELKSRTLYFRMGNETLKKYRIAAGTKTDNGDKQKEGDYRTPRGEFFICTKQVYSPPKGYIGSRWMLLSYPNIEAAERGLQSSLISRGTYNKIINSIRKKNIPPQDTPLGNAIGIHGGARQDLPADWTAGCIGMYDQDVEEIFDYIKVGTKVIVN